MVLRWQTALRSCPDLPRKLPSRAAVLAVSLVVSGYADSDGRNSFPSIATIEREAGVSVRTVRQVLAALVADGWLTVEAKAIPWHRPTVYRLRLPMGADEHPYGEPPMGAHEHPYDEPLMGAARGAEEHPDLLPPSISEEVGEEEGADGGSADAPPPAPILSIPPQ